MLKTLYSPTPESLNKPLLLANGFDFGFGFIQKLVDERLMVTLAFTLGSLGTLALHINRKQLKSRLLSKSVS